MRHLQLDICEGLIESSSIFQPFSNLQTLNIQISRWSEKRHELVSEIASLITRSPDLQDLLVQVHPLFRGSSVTFGALFPSLDSPEQPLRLKRIDLEHICITPDDIQANTRYYDKLERLSIMNNPWVKRPDVAYANIWTVLRKNCIYLHALTTDAIGGSEFVEYLTSFTGLRELVIVSRYLHDNDDIRRVNTVIAHHHETLEILDLGSRVSWSSCPWIRSATEDIHAQLAGISRCEYLRELAVHYEYRLGTPVEFDHRALLVCVHYLFALLCAQSVAMVPNLFVFILGGCKVDLVTHCSTVTKTRPLGIPASNTDNDVWRGLIVGCD